MVVAQVVEQPQSAGFEYRGRLGLFSGQNCCLSIISLGVDLILNKHDEHFLLLSYFLSSLTDVKFVNCNP